MKVELSNRIQTYTKPNQKPTHFKGYLANERILTSKGKIIDLRHETAFFRESKTLEYIVNYLKRNFPELRKKRILVGACSTGEESLSLEMLIGNEAHEITGFDISPKVIKRAQKGIYSIEIPINSDSCKYIEDFGISAFNDAFLAFKENNLTPRDIRYIRQFRQMFSEIHLFDGRDNFLKYLSLCLDKLGNLGLINTKSKFYKLQESKNDSLKYVVGDITNLQDIVQGTKYQAFTFRNAFYHLITTNNDFRKPLSPKETEDILAPIFAQINKALDIKGLFAIGKAEHEQKCDMDTFTKLIKKFGFKEAIHKYEPYCHIWKKVKEY